MNDRINGKIDLVKDERVAWEKEFQKKGIPSSYRNEASGVVISFLHFLHSKGIKKGNCLDLGCGRGRNSVFLARNGFTMSCIDYVQSNINCINENYNFATYCQSISEKFPFKTESFDVVIDIFSYKHLTDKMQRIKYRDEVLRVLKKGGYYLLSLSHTEDGYYGQLLKNKPNRENLVLDPVIGVHSILFTEQDIKREFNAFKILQSNLKTKQGEMHGNLYQRKTLW